MDKAGYVSLERGAGKKRGGSKNCCKKSKNKIISPKKIFIFKILIQECVSALEKTWHPECFVCVACKKSLGTASFHIEEGQPYCSEGNIH